MHPLRNKDETVLDFCEILGIMSDVTIHALDMSTKCSCQGISGITHAGHALLHRKLCTRAASPEVAQGVTRDNVVEGFRCILNCWGSLTCT